MNDLFDAEITTPKKRQRTEDEPDNSEEDWADVLPKRVNVDARTRQRITGKLHVPMKPTTEQPPRKRLSGESVPRPPPSPPSAAQIRMDQVKARVAARLAQQAEAAETNAGAETNDSAGVIPASTAVA